jgi:BirA family biotin operon repressor/biotin-[acetyl-CoA-carboxylase] ligase
VQNNTFSGLFVGQNIVELPQVDSTNNYLRSELSKSAPLNEGTVILAEHQYAGRGQINNTWEAEPGKNLTFSLLLNPVFLRPDQQFLLNKAISIAINEVLYRIVGQRVKIKWPNDIYVDDLKLGGMLIENIIQGSTWKHAIVGIGLNVNQLVFSENLKNATSLKVLLNREYNKRTLLTDLCIAIEQWYQKLKALAFAEIETEYFTRLYRSAGDHKFRVKGEEVTGKITDVTQSGLLVVDFLGNHRTFDLKEIEFLI